MIVVFFNAFLTIPSPPHRTRGDIPKEVVDSVMKELTFFPPTEQIFSATGCKRVAEKVDFVMVDIEDSQFARKNKIKDEIWTCEVCGLKKTVMKLC